MSTFGTLKEASQKLSFPSTLTYKERIHLRDCDSVEYKRMHNTKSRRGPVWKRLEADAWARQGVPCHQYSFWAGHGPGAKETVGYTQAVADRHISMPPKGFEMIDPPASRLHRLTLERYRKHFPSEFYASIRPHTSTTNQTLRMLGTYACDADFADRYSRNLHSSQYPAAL